MIFLFNIIHRYLVIYVFYDVLLVFMTLMLPDFENNFYIFLFFQKF